MCLRAEFALSTVTTVTGAIVSNNFPHYKKHQIVISPAHHYVNKTGDLYTAILYAQQVLIWVLLCVNSLPYLITIITRLL